MIGYFPTYALGNLISAQWWEKMVADHPDIPNEIASGNFAPVLAWMRENVHRYSSRYDPQDLVQKITGSRINPEPYMRYLEQKYSQIYQL